ncbi:MAG TPA: hypothetical protein VGW34_04105 [Allosphingosinicella sp.]|nr:hypothetical protein [Allosphingosinicella sp.]
MDEDELAEDTGSTDAGTADEAGEEEVIELVVDDGAGDEGSAGEGEGGDEPVVEGSGEEVPPDEEIYYTLYDEEVPPDEGGGEPVEDGGSGDPEEVPADEEVYYLEDDVPAEGDGEESGGSEDGEVVDEGDGGWEWEYPGEIGESGGPIDEFGDKDVIFTTTGGDGIGGAFDPRPYMSGSSGPAPNERGDEGGGTASHGAYAALFEAASGAGLVALVREMMVADLPPGTSIA